MTGWRSFFVGAIILAGGCNSIPSDAATILKNADTLELFSLQPGLPGNRIDGGFHGFNVLGQTEINHGKQRTELVAAFKKGVAEGEAAATCFDPRHGIRVTRNGTVVDFVICFECSQVELYVNDVKQKILLISASPKPTFDDALKRAGIPLAKEPTL